MAVVIQNMGGDMGGVCVYNIYINRTFITSFKHDRTTGLEKCLKKASKAVGVRMQDIERKIAIAISESERSVRNEEKPDVER